MSNQKKKILYLVTQSELGGAQIYVFDLVSHLKDKYEIEVGFGEQGEKGELAQKLKEIGVKYHAIPDLKRNILLKNDLSAFRQIRKLIKKIKPDIIHLNSSKISILGSLANIFLKPKVIYTAHGWVFNEPKRNTEFYKTAERFTAKFKDKIICISEFEKQAALKERITEEKKIITVYNGIKPVNFLEKDKARNQLLAKIPNNSKFQVQENDILIGTVGNLYKNKGFEYLINAGNLIIDKNPNIKIMIIGKDAGEKKELENWIRQFRMEKNIILLGQVPNSAAYLKAFDLYVCSSIKEGLSYTIIEAMAAGLPIIATQVGGNGELIGDTSTHSTSSGQAGILSESQNAEKLAGSIVNTLKNPELMQKMAINAKEKAEKRFTIDKMIKETDKVYRKILNI